MPGGPRKPSLELLLPHTPYTGPASGTDLTLFLSPPPIVVRTPRITAPHQGSTGSYNDATCGRFTLDCSGFSQAAAAIHHEDTATNPFSAIWHGVVDAEHWVAAHKSQAAGWAELGLGILSFTPVGWVADTAFVLGTGLSVITTVHACASGQGSECAVGAASLLFGGASLGLGRMADNLTRIADSSGILTGGLLSGVSVLVRSYGYAMNGTSVFASGMSALCGARQSC